MDAYKITQLVDRLLDRTKSKTINWEKTNREGIYQVSLPKYSIRISEKQESNNFGTYRLAGSDEFQISIYGEEGELLDSFTEADLRNSGVLTLGNKFEELFKLARRSASGADEAIDDILGYL